MKSNVVWIIIIWSLAFFPISNRVFKKVTNFCNQFNLIWVVCSVISSLGWHNFYIPSEVTYGYILCMVVCFDVISCIYVGILLPKPQLFASENNETEIINHKLLVFLLFVFDLIMFPVIIKNIHYILNGQIKLAHSLALKGSAGGSFTRLQDLLYQFVIQPYFVAVYIITMYYIGYKRNASKKMLLPFAISIASEMIIKAGRHPIVIVLIFFISVFSLKESYKYKEVNHKRLMKVEMNRIKEYRNVIILATVGLAGLIVISVGRLIGQMSVGETFYQYIGGNVIFLDRIISNPIQFGISKGKYLYGLGTFGMITIPISLILAVFTGDYQGVTVRNGVYISKFYHISPTIMYNAGSTILYTFFRDYGKAGAVIGTSFFAIMASFIYVKCIKTEKRALWCCLWIFVNYLIIYSFWHYEAAQSMVLCIYWVIFFTSKKKIRLLIRKN